MHKWNACTLAEWHFLFEELQTFAATVLHCFFFTECVIVCFMQHDYYIIVYLYSTALVASNLFLFLVSKMGDWNCFLFGAFFFLIYSTSVLWKLHWFSLVKTWNLVMLGGQKFAPQCSFADAGFDCLKHECMYLPFRGQGSTAVNHSLLSLTQAYFLLES